MIPPNLEVFYENSEEEKMSKLKVLKWIAQKIKKKKLHNERKLEKLNKKRQYKVHDKSGGIKNKERVK